MKKVGSLSLRRVRAWVYYFITFLIVRRPNIYAVLRLSRVRQSYEPTSRFHMEMSSPKDGKGGPGGGGGSDKYFSLREKQGSGVEPWAA